MIPYNPVDFVETALVLPIVERDLKIHIATCIGACRIGDAFGNNNGPGNVRFVESTAISTHVVSWTVGPD
jgi:hypothetical protein